MLKRVKSKLVRVIIIVFLTLLTLLTTFIIIVFIGGSISQKSTYTKPFLDKDGLVLKESIAEYKRLKIGGTTQSLLIRGKSVNNPVLLFVHGGPGSGIIGQAKANAILEDYFTVVYWDQYGASKSYTPFLKNSHLTIDQFISDGHDVTQYIKKMLAKDKIVMIGHSWGSALGAYLAYKYPDDYLVFIGVGQLVNFRENIKGSYEYSIAQARNANNAIAIAELEAIYGLWNLEPEEVYSKSAHVGKWMVYYGGYYYGKSNVNSWFEDPFTDEFTIFDAVPWLLGQTISVYKMFPELIREIDLASQVPELKMPYYLFMGKSDYDTPWYMAEQYFNKIKAPKKTLIWFDQSGHEPFSEEPIKFNRVMIDVIRTDISTLTKNLY